MTHKTLLVFCDGPVPEGVSAPPVARASVQRDNTQVASKTGDTPLVEEASDSFQYATNVLRLARSVKNVDANGNKQIVYYQSGEGSRANLEGVSVTCPTPLQVRTAFAKIRDVYVFVAQNYEVGDEICLFGFSSGAYIARKLSGLIDHIGLLTRQNLGLFFGIWHQLSNNETPRIPADTRRVDIKCVGVWDTVGFLYNDIEGLKISDTRLPPTVKVGLHAVSLQENRKKFLPTLWTTPSGGPKSDQVLKQVWFAGAHHDVGGGYERHELADITLFWMAGEVKSLIDLDLDFLRSYAQANPDLWGTSQPHNGYIESFSVDGSAIEHQTRLENGRITPQSILHQSVMYSPEKLQSPDYMITTNIIEQSFGSGFASGCPDLNEFEQFCKDHWRRGLGAENPETMIMQPQWVRPGEQFVPPCTIVGGHEVEEDITLYVARAKYQRGIHPGKASNAYETVYISFDGKEVEFPITSDAVDVLVGYEWSVRWAPVYGRFTLDQLNGAVPVPGGYEADPDSAVLYVARAALHNGVHCGKVKVNSHAYIPYEGQEEFATGKYDVLVYA